MTSPRSSLAQITDRDLSDPASRAYREKRLRFSMFLSLFLTSFEGFSGPFCLRN